MKDGELTHTQVALLTGLCVHALQLGNGGGTKLDNGKHISGITVRRIVGKRYARYEGAYGLHITEAGREQLKLQGQGK